MTIALISIGNIGLGLAPALSQEPVAGPNIDLGYGAGVGPGIAPTWIRKAA